MGWGKSQHIQVAKDAEIKRFTIGKLDSRKKSRVWLCNLLLIPQKIKSLKYTFTQKSLKTSSV